MIYIIQGDGCQCRHVYSDAAGDKGWMNQRSHLRVALRKNHSEQVLPTQYSLASKLQLR